MPAVLAAGPLDIVGDVHGELDALDDLLRHLGYDVGGFHPEQRTLVFVGDLCDRGPDSPGVLRRVAALVGAGRAQCVLGNHELNLLRGAPKPANGWFFADDHDRAANRFTASRPATAAERESITAFVATMPLALERPDLRVVHAAWHAPSLAALATEAPERPLLAVYRDYAAAVERWMDKEGLKRELAEEYRIWGRHLGDASLEVPLLPTLGITDERFQMANPVRVLTSGVEQLADAPFYASGKWRMVDRVAWWRDYRDEVPVIFGHYWRFSATGGSDAWSRGERDLFAGLADSAWLGPLRTAYCVDFSVGVRYRERELSSRRVPGTFAGRLAAVRWPERQLVYDDGATLSIDGPG